jgi:hypothetical protein
MARVAPTNVGGPATAHSALLLIIYQEGGLVMKIKTKVRAGRGGTCVPRIDDYI